MTDTKLIYILDGSSVSRRLLEKKLTTGLFRVDLRSFSSRSKMMECMEHTVPDILVIDYYLGKSLTNPSIIREIRRHNSELLIISISSSEDPTIAMESIKAGANNFSPKRDFDRITRMIKNHLRIRGFNLKGMDGMLDLCKQNKRERLMAGELVSFTQVVNDTFVQVPDIPIELTNSCI